MSSQRSTLSYGFVLAAFLAGCGQQARPLTPSETAKALKEGAAATRRIVKTASDPDAAKIDLTPKDTTVEEIAAQPQPTTALASRVGPFETSTWRVQAKLESIKLMKDGDYYLVMRGEKGGETVVEVPDPKECLNSPLHDKIAAARKELETRYHPTKELKTLGVKATVTGVGFLGFGGNKKSGSHSGARLMPGIGFDFGPKP